MTASSWLAIAHAIPGRTRLRSPLLRKNEARCHHLADVLAAMPGVHEVEVRPFTGSALVLHARDVAASALAGAAAAALDGAKVLASGERPPVPTDIPAFSAVARKLACAVQEIDRDIRRASNGSVDLGTLAALGFVGAGAAEVARSGQLPLPPWFNLAWWGFRTFVTTEADEIQFEADAHR
jgi:hypothetical protein